MSDLKLSRRERQIMDVIYASGHATATQVVAALPDPPSRTAVRTLLTILEDKGHLRHRMDGREYLYSPTHAKSRAAASALRRVLDTFFDGSLEKAVAVHLTNPASKIADDEIERLLALIKDAKKKGGER